ncbi:SGNH/GDSL hydrolase family protein [Verrucomicrobia bacterium S94]|nr:SGNH/GDSL hydrolase family protein [Verrucomicrobia bacterium S94]
MPGYEGSVDWNYSARFKQMLGPDGVKINDLGDYTRTRLSEMVQYDSNLPTPLGAQLMAEQVANAVLEAFNEGQDPGRPRILIVGDSIVGGYYGATRNRFAGEAIVYSGGTTYNDPHPDWKKIVDEYIAKGGERGWDVIQFNWGLHAMKHVDTGNKTIDADKPGARIQFSPEEYIQQLELFVKELKRTGAQLVFATTTPIPEDCPGSIIFLDQSAYNEPAKKLMKREGIVINDLYAFALPRMKELMIPRNVHFTAYGSEQLAEQNYSVLSPLICDR